MLQYTLTAVSIALALYMLFFLLRILVRREWLAGLIIVLIFSTLPAMGHHSPAAALAVNGFTYSLGIVVLIRSGLVALTTGILVSSILPGFPLTLDPSVWYFGQSLFAILITLALAVYAFWISLAGRPIFRDELLQDV